MRRGEAEESNMIPREVCPQCGSRRYKRTGHTHTGKQNHRCKLCGRAFVLNPEYRIITEEQRTLIERLSLERISLRLETELDERWSFVGHKANRQWVWIAMDANTRQVIAFHVGDHSSPSATALWEKIPAIYQEQAMFFTDQYAVYTGVIPSARHRAISKLARKTNHVERFNCTLRQRVSRLRSHQIFHLSL